MLTDKTLTPIGVLMSAVIILLVYLIYRAVARARTH